MPELRQPQCRKTGAPLVATGPRARDDCILNVEEGSTQRLKGAKPSVSRAPLRPPPGCGIVRPPPENSYQILGCLQNSLRTRRTSRYKRNDLFQGLFLLEPRLVARLGSEPLPGRSPGQFVQAR